ncbi:MAG: amidohydrolase [Acidimicrobiia bacterium]|nr:amidohydrolase [Acidimicrobiia bacterium]
MVTTLYSARLLRAPEVPTGDAILVEDGVVRAVGDRHDLSAATTSGPETRWPEAVILPGLRDSHIHPVAYAAALRGTTLATARDFDDLVSRLRTAAIASSGPVLGMRLNEEALRERRLPDRRVLDTVAGDRPVLAHRYCGHVAVANSAALALAGIDATTPDPAGGLLDRDESGQPTGVLRETAIELVAESLGGGNEVSAHELLSALDRLAGVGITSIGAMLRTGAGAWASLGNEVDIAVAAADRIPINMSVYVIDESPDTVYTNKTKIDGAGGRLRWLGVKRFGDGSFGGHTAAMHERFIDVATTGTMRLSSIDRDIVAESLRLGGGAALHAIGDRACGAVLDLFEEQIELGADPRKLRIEHASVMTPTDIDRLGRSGIIAAVQPPFLGSEATWLENRLGAVRIGMTYPFASMERAGAVLAGGSDSPVEPPDPWEGMALAQDRAGLAPGQAVTARSALAMYTTGAATSLEEPVPLAVGSPADFIVVDRDPLAVSPDELRATEVIATYVDGVELPIDRTLPLWPE